MNQHISKIPKHVFFQIGLFVPALYRHNLARTCKALNPITGLFRHYRHQMRHSIEYQKIRNEEKETKNRVAFFFSSSKMYPFIPFNFEDMLSVMCNFIERGHDWTIFIDQYTCVSASRLMILTLTAIGIMNVYQHCSHRMYQKLCNLATYQFDNFIHDEVYIMLRQFNIEFLERVDQKLKLTQHIYNFSTKMLNWEEIFEKIKFDATH